LVIVRTKALTLSRDREYVSFHEEAGSDEALLIGDVEVGDANFGAFVEEALDGCETDAGVARVTIFEGHLFREGVWPLGRRGSAGFSSRVAGLPGGNSS